MRKSLVPAIVVLLFTGLCTADPLIKLENATFDPLAGVPPALASRDRPQAEPDGRRYLIVQFRGPVLDEWKQEAQAAGAELLDYIPDFAFIVRADGAAEAGLRGLSSVRWVGDYAPAYRMSRHLPRDGHAEVVIRIFPGARAEHVTQAVVGAGGRVTAPTGPGEVIHARVPAAAVERIAGAAGLAWVEPWFDRRLRNDTARGIMTVDRAWMDVGLFGAGQIAAVADTGLDNGNNDATLSADFSGRLLKAYALGRKNDWSDSNGHGTHVAGSVLGSGVLSGSNPSAHSYAASFAGVAPEASLVFQAVMDNSGRLSGIPTDLNQLFAAPYQDGARVHANSWGAPYLGAYTTDSRNTDAFAWSHKDVVICFSAGNGAVDTNPADGRSDSDSLDSPGTAKNCITVGASESQTNRGPQGTWGQYWPSDFPAEPIKSDKVADNSIGMAAWSSRGPTDDGRIKPDICAPGTNIISCRSHHRSAGALWGIYDDHYVLSGGTSMSTPLVAGACLLVREFYLGRGVSPSSALVKAALLNGARELAPGQYSSPTEIPSRPNSVEGWGRLDLRNSIIPASPRLVHSLDISPGLSTSASANYDFYVVSAAVPLRMTLVWTDSPGSSGAGTKLVNDLDLTVVGPEGSVYRGNGTTDRLNNVEGVEIANPQTGLYAVNVSAYNVPQGPQPYALTVSGAATTSHPTSRATVADAKALQDGAVVSLSGKIVTAGSDQMKNAFYIQDADRTSGIRVQYGPGGGPMVPMGAAVSVVGTLATDSGERVLQDPVVLDMRT